MWSFWNQAAILGKLACMALFLLAFLVIVGLFRWVCLLNLLVCLVLPPRLTPSLLSLPPTQTRVCIPFLLIFASSISTPYPNQGLYPHPAMTGVQLVIVVWGSLWLEKKKRRLLWCEEQWWLALVEWLWDASDHCLASWRCRGPN